MTEAQKAALARGQETLAAKRAERKAAAAAAGTVQLTSVEYREAQQARAVPPPPPPIPKTLDEVVARHTQPAVPSVEQVARETKLYTVGSDPLPPPEDNPHLNDGIVASSDAAPDLVGVQAPKNLADLMSMVPTIGDGQYYVEVIRRAPQHYGGSTCKGTQRPIKEYMTDTDFVSFYGGGDYTLTLYGPPPRGGTMDARTGRPRSKALSPPVKLEISPSIYPPNVQAAVLHDYDDEMHAEGEDTTMRYYQPGFTSGMPPRPPTSADARLLEVQLTHDEKMRDREEARDKAIRSEQAGVSASLGPMLDVVHRNTMESVKVVERTAAERARLAEQATERAEQERLRTEARAEERIKQANEQLALERSRPTDTQQMMSGISSLVTALKPSDSGASAQLTAQLAASQGETKAAQAEAKASKEALDQARQEIQRLTKAQSDELTRLQDKHGTEVKRLQDDHRAELTRRQEQERNESERQHRQHLDEMKRLEERLKDDKERAERRAEEAERKAEQRVTDAEARAERRIGELREEHRRMLDDLRTQNQQRLDDERRQHDRDMKSQASSYDTRLAGQKDMYDNRMTTMAAEITRISADADRWRKDAEDNKDLGKHIEKAQEAAAALGWGPNQGAEEPAAPKDWKEMLGRIGMDLVQKLPDIVQSAGETVTKLRGTPGPTPEQVQAMQYQAMQQSAEHSMARHLAGMSGPLPPPMRTPGGAVYQPPPLRFGTEDSSAPLDPGAPQAGYEQFASPPAFQTYQAPPPPSPFQAPPAPQTYQAAGAPPAAAPQTYQPAGLVPAPGVAPAPAAPPAAPPAPGLTQAPAGAVPAVIPPEMIIQFAPVLEQALAASEPVENIAQELLQLLGRGNLAAVVNGLKPERVVVELQKAGKGSSPLVRRPGQQFLRELWAACGTLLAQPG